VKAGGLVPPDIGGRIRSYHILKELARGHEVTLFTFYAAFPDDPHPELNRQFHRSICLPLEIPERGTVGDYLNLGRGIVSGLPYSVTKYCRPETEKRLQELTRGSQFDALVCDFVLPAAIIPHDLPYPKIIFTHNVEATIFKRHYEISTNPLWNFIWWREYRSMERFERTHLSHADRVLAVSDADREAFATFLPPDKIDVIPTGVDTDYFRPGDESKENFAELVFTGSMDWMPNEDGMFYFVQEILPAIRAKIPGVTLTIIGRNPSERLKQLVSHTTGVLLTGRVDDIRPYVESGAVYVVPLRVGSGTRLKIFEAMAMGKAIVTTTIGAEGLPVTNGEDVLCADDPARFADAVIQLASDRELRRTMGKAARRLVEERYSWASVAGIFELVLRDTCERYSQATSASCNA
jgi:sugar transferase (PEP-CTERM/EpsH1 system associated)